MINFKADPSERVGHLTVVAQKNSGCGILRLRCRYTVEVASWRKMSKNERLDVDKEAFEHLEPYQPVIVITRQGRFGLKWIEEIKTLDQEQLKIILSHLQSNVGL